MVHIIGKVVMSDFHPLRYYFIHFGVVLELRKAFWGGGVANFLIFLIKVEG